ncbi:aKG-HExxH-type peptide beta-hydroxylase [Streptomyces sp. NPDC102467]|uniref:aKG-HExxH-type peptide beta-hydroxylase n=1 Tax=Streptomyces sp. NPDC102467 TaxID=3366179 RepID=UPI00380DBF3E
MPSGDASTRLGAAAVGRRVGDPDPRRRCAGARYRARRRLRLLGARRHQRLRLRRGPAARRRPVRQYQRHRSPCPARRSAGCGGRGDLGCRPLAHEAQHNKFAALPHLFDLFEPGGTELYYTAWRPDPRPPFALFHGAYAHTGVAQFWNRRRETGRPTRRAAPPPTSSSRGGAPRRVRRPGSSLTRSASPRWATGSPIGCSGPWTRCAACRSLPRHDGGRRSRRRPTGRPGPTGTGRRQRCPRRTAAGGAGVRPARGDEGQFPWLSATSRSPGSPPAATVTGVVTGG